MVILNFDFKSQGDKTVYSASSSFKTKSQKSEMQGGIYSGFFVWEI